MVSQLEQIIDQSYNQLYAFAFRMIGNHQDTEDVLQNAFLRAYSKIDQFEERAQLRTWIHRIVTNECYRFFEVNKKQNLPLIRITESRGISEEEFFNSIEYEEKYDEYLIIDEMREKCLQGFLKCMPKMQRVCFLLKTCLELKNQEIADILDISLDNVKVTLYRGRKFLQEMFNMRCSIIDPEKPCKCHLWIHFMREHNLKLPSEYEQPKIELLKQEYFKNMKQLHKIEYMYKVKAKYDKNEFISQLKKITEVL